MSYKKIFVALDDSPEKNRVFEKALEIASNHKAELCIGHVVNTGPIEAAGAYPEDLLPHIKKDFDEKIMPLVEQAKNNKELAGVSYVNEVGQIRETLLEKEIEPFKPDLVICGARGLSPIRYALLGSVSSFLVKHVTCDVLIIKDSQMKED